MKNTDIKIPENLLELLLAQKRPLRMDAMLRILGLGRQQKKDLTAKLRELEAEGKITYLPGGFWAPVASLKTIKGQFRIFSRGALVVPEPGSHGCAEEIYIKPSHTHGAWHNDIVKVLLIPGSHGSQGKIIEIVERTQKEVLARVEKRQGQFLLCKPTDRKFSFDFSVRMDPGIPLALRLKPGTLLSLKPEKELTPDLWAASIINIYGAEDRIEVQEAIVKTNHHVPAEFPELALQQAVSLPDQPEARDFQDREDLRYLPFITIDGADARDFDDAIHVEKNGSGWLLRVAIADVSHYVREDRREGSLDQEALRRGNSWYFPRSVEPMLPKALSNGLCSLRPHEDRLAVMAEIPFTQNGTPQKPRFALIVMRSAARLTYDQAFEFFEARCMGKNLDTPKLPAEIAPMLAQAFELYRLLEKRRHERGTLDFDLPEPAYEFDAEGKLLDMTIAGRNSAHKLIEEFMIAANEAVARYLGSTPLHFLYRVHPKPEQQKIDALYETLRATSLEIVPKKKEDMDTPKGIQAILGKAKGTAQDYAVNRLCLRSMQQARYQPVNVGHFGLASTDYCHFTSPIRRYADLTVHRALKTALGLKGYARPTEESLWEVGDQLNKLEREAIDCEREMAKKLACLALKDRIGEHFKGSISGVTDFGVFVELSEMPAEGMVRLSNLGNDWFELDTASQRLTGKRTGQTWYLGQPLGLVLDSVDLDRMEINFRLDGKVEKRQPPRKAHRKGLVKTSDKPLPNKAAQGSRHSGPNKPRTKRHR